LRVVTRRRLDATDALQREPGDAAELVAVADQVERAALRQQRVRLEVVLLGLVGRALVRDRQAVLAHQRLHDLGDRVRLARIVAGDERCRVELAIEVRELRSQRLGKLLEQAVARRVRVSARLGAVERARHREREEDRRRGQRGRVGRGGCVAQPQQAPLFTLHDLDQRLTIGVDQLATRLDVAQQGALADRQTLLDVVEAPAVRMCG
jgi:hypothetical protein